MRKAIFRLLGLIRKTLSPIGLERLPGLRPVYFALKRRLKTDVAVVDGHRLHLDPGDSLDLSINPSYEAFERRIAAEEIRMGDVVLDIGANSGFFTLHFARLVGPEGHVFAFEPDPGNFHLLQQNVQENGYGNVTLIPKAVSNSNGRSRLFLCDSNVGDHRIYRSAGEDRASVEIETIRIDDFLAGSERPVDFIKMDIQGAEMLALEGMENTLRTSPSQKMLIEFWPWGLVKCGTDPKDLLAFLRSCGFRISELDEERGKVVPLEDDRELLAKYPPDRAEHTNLLCVK
jgi:FkbM family methyltransferase